MATIRARQGTRGTTYLAEIRIKGHKPARKSFPSKTLAKSWAVRTEAAMKERRYQRTVEAERHTFGDMIDRYIRELDLPKSRTSQLEWWKDEIGEMILADVTSAVINEKKAELLQSTTRLKTRMSRATINRYLSALSHVFSLAVGWEWIEVSPMAGKKVRKEKEPAGRVRFLNDDERKNLLDACQRSAEPLLYPLVVLALSTGARAGELLSLRWQDLDLKKGIGALHKTKNSERRALPVKGKALELITAMSKIRRIDTDLIFPSPGGIRPFDYVKSWKAALEKAEIEDFRFHDLRHSAASYLAMNGASLPEIAGVLGHKTMQMVKRYAHLSDDHVAGIVETMNKAIFDPPKDDEKTA